jgi:DNA-directed RNA polymerase subunit H (RpoH/RPB5)
MENFAARIKAGIKTMLLKRSLVPGDFNELKIQTGMAIQIPISSSCMTDNNQSPATVPDSSIKKQSILFYAPIDQNNIAKINNEIVKQLFVLLANIGSNHLIVCYNQIAPQANELLSNNSVFRIELFPYRHLLFDPTEHVLYSPHTLLSDPEYNTELAKIQKNTLPLISESDRIVKYFGWIPGGVVKITRKTAVPYYRLITKD